MSTTSSQTAEQKARAAERDLPLLESKHDVLEATINAAELYMRALRLASSSSDKARLDSKCKELLTRAEEIKRANSRSEDGDGSPAPSPSLPSSPALKQPISKRKLTTREEIIILEGSKLNGFIFAPWKHDPAPEEFILKEGHELFEDSPSLQLSPLQLRTFAGWKRPWEAFAGIEISKDGVKLSTQPTMQRVKKVDLVQDMTSDCSVVASLCAGSARAERGYPRILSSVMFPYDHTNMLPAISSSSKYILRLYFNGCYRKVVVDDLLPSSTDSRVFHVVDRCNPGYLWPALLEKAYLKVRGGYDFPGSNSGTDLAVLTGWVPEQVFLHDEDVIAEELWMRIFKAFTYGDVLITIGTGKLSKREQRHLGLAAEHDYAVLDMREIRGMREMLIKNPWSDGDVWKGALRPRSESDEATEQQVSPSFEQLSIKHENEILAPGTFWMDLGSVFQHFENLYLNWNPGLFSYRQDYHFTWDLSSQPSMTGSFETNPQFSVKCSQSGPLWLLLNRHFRTCEHQSKDKVPHGFISLYLFRRDGHRVLLSDGAMIRGPYVDSPNTVVKFEAEADVCYTVVPAAQDLPATKLNFTLSAFARCSVELSLAQKRYQSVVTQNAAWTRSTAGGNSDSPNYLANPQFALKLPARADVALILGSMQPESESQAALHLKIFFTDGSRVVILRTRDIVAHSGDYRRGSAAIETNLERGTYTIICSTFEAGQMGKFTISVHSSLESPSSLRPLPAEGSGQLTNTSPPAIFASGTNRLLAPLTATRLTKVSLVVQALRNLVRGSTSPRASSPLKLTLEQGQGPYKSCLATSSPSNEVEYSDPTTGVRIDHFGIRPDMHRPGTGGLWVVLQRMTGSSAAMQIEEVFQVLIMAEERVVIGAWGVGDG